jgi:hypothetical protein
MTQTTADYEQPEPKAPPLRTWQREAVTPGAVCVVVRAKNNPTTKAGKGKWTLDRVASVGRIPGVFGDLITSVMSGRKTDVPSVGAFDAVVDGRIVSREAVEGVPHTYAISIPAMLGRILRARDPTTPCKRCR